MSWFEVRLRDGTTETIEGADAYQPDGQLTSFFALDEGRTTIDCWSTRVASIRTAEIVSVRRWPARRRLGQQQVDVAELVPEVPLLEAGLVRLLEEAAAGDRLQHQQV